MVFNIQQTFKINDAQLGLLLGVAIAVAGVSSAVMAHLADRVGARRLLWVAMAIWSVLLVVLSAVAEKWAFVVALVLVEIAGGCIDTAMNAEVSHRLIGHPAVLVRFHALFNAGALIGAGVAGIVLHAGVSWRWIWPGVAVVAAVVAIWAASANDKMAVHHRHSAQSADPAAGHPSADASGTESPSMPRERHPIGRLRRDGLLVLLVVFALAEVTEGGVDTWGVLFLAQPPGDRGPARGRCLRGRPIGGGDHPGGGGSLFGETLGPPRPHRRGVRGRRGILLELVVPWSGLAAVGLALGAGGASLFWPLVMSTVSSLATQVVSAVGTFTAAGYIGWVAGVPVVGWVSQHYGPARGLQVLAVAAFAVAAISFLRPERRSARAVSG